MLYRQANDEVRTHQEGEKAKVPRNLALVCYSWAGGDEVGAPAHLNAVTAV